MSYIDLPIRRTLSNKIWGHVKRTHPDLTLADALDFALKQYMKYEKANGKRTVDQ